MSIPILRPKYAVLSMDIEDWFHLDYFDRSKCDCTYSLLDGLEVYLKILSDHGIPSSFFVLGELVEKLRKNLPQITALGHEIGSHGWNHVRPLTLSTDVFQKDILRSKKVLEDALGQTVFGYRAPCYSLDRQRLDLVQQAGYTYDSSRIQFNQHPLYGTLDMAGFAQCSRNIYRRDGFCEFQLSTLAVAGRNIPVSGGGYIRIFPWWLMRRWLERYLTENEIYVLYIHPFELSPRPAPPVPHDTKRLTRFRFQYGRSLVPSRLVKLIELLKAKGFTFTTFSKLRDKVTSDWQLAMEPT